MKKIILFFISLFPFTCSTMQIQQQNPLVRTSCCERFTNLLESHPKTTDITFKTAIVLSIGGGMGTVFLNSTAGLIVIGTGALAMLLSNPTEYIFTESPLYLILKRCCCIKSRTHNTQQDVQEGNHRQVTQI